MVARLTSWAHHLADGVLRPARGERTGPVVGLAKGNWIREDRLAPWYVAPRGRQAELISDDAALGDRDRAGERVKAPSTLCGVPGETG